MKKSSNQRKALRTECTVPTDGQSGSTLDQTKTVDISKTGLGFVSRHAFRVNETIALELDLEEQGNPIFVFGQVKWIKPIAGNQHYRVGFQFTDYLGQSKTRLSRYFAKS